MHISNKGIRRQTSGTFACKAGSSAVNSVEVEGFISPHNKLPVLVRHGTL